MIIDPKKKCQIAGISKTTKDPGESDDMEAQRGFLEVPICDVTSSVWTNGDKTIETMKWP